MFLTHYTSLCVCSHIHVYMGSLVCFHASEGQRSTLGISLFHSLPYFLRQALAVNPELTVLAKVAGQQAPRIFLPVIYTTPTRWPQHSSYRLLLLSSRFLHRGWGSELRCSCLHSEHFEPSPHSCFRPSSEQRAIADTR